MQQSSSKQIIIISCLLFICLGICTSAIGPLLPELAGNAQVNLAMIGAVFSAFFTGSIVSQFIMGPIADRFGLRLVLIIGVLVSAAGLTAYDFKLSFAAILVFSTLAGLGMGAIVLGNNVLIATTFANRNVSALNLVNFFYGVGSISGPAIVSLVVSRFGSGRWVVGFDAFAYLFMLPFILRLRIPKIAPMHAEAKIAGAGLFKSPLIWTLAAISLLYVGLEVGLGGWITTYINLTTLLPLETAALVTSGFWLAFTMGRLLNSWLGMHLTPDRILLINLGGAGLSCLVFALSPGYQWITIISLFVMGFNFGAIFPTLVAAASSAFPSRPGQAVSIVSSLGSGGGVLIPLILGYLIQQFGPSSSAWSAVAIIVMMMVLLLVIRKTLIKSAPSTVS